MGKTTVKPGNTHYDEGGRMPSTTGNPSGNNRGNNPPAGNTNTNHGNNSSSQSGNRK